MRNHEHFQAWLRLARSLDWSGEHRDATCVRAFTALQLAVQKCAPIEKRPAGEMQVSRPPVNLFGESGSWLIDNG